MKQRGRKSAAAKEMIRMTSNKKLEPPAELTSDQAAEWDKIVSSMPDDWFPDETRPVLVNMCRHIVTCRKLSAQIDAMLNDPSQTAQLDKLLQMRDRESRGLMACATKLRLTNQSRMRTETAGRRHSGGVANMPKPWEFTG